MILAAGYCRSKNIFVEAIVVPELKFRDIQRHVFRTDLVESADNAALEDAPEAFNRIGVDSSDNVLLMVMIHHPMRKLFQIIRVARPRVGRQQADFVGNSFVDEFQHCLRGDFIEHAGDDVTLALHGANDQRLIIPTLSFCPNADWVSLPPM